MFLGGSILPRKYRIVVLPGDGVGAEVIPEAFKVLKAVEEVTSGLSLESQKLFSFALSNSL